ncbi:polynucleotide adenylyltransferase PcnB [Roseateles koreensis]|uniref:Poly(A) polymerase I n=1 Tax=Roseateles koreensis TaxID=2987526 RepID=A0ABT5KSW8_9BURK|nr:polynucleotide adenylyltransferase PcnB [Roseateles koreensis]MDC8786032.1 polynucleotide adenylyltransferase PcnB [Roseateles koreensis]
MIKKFLDKLLGKPSVAKVAGAAKAHKAPAAAKAGKTSGSPLGKRSEVQVGEHRIDPNLLDERAVRVVQTLSDAGYEAYIVGGAVRDLLLGMRPKDFDVATDATPEQVKGLFRRAFIIGRRFRIVHVVYGRGREHEVIEVSTFRALLVNDDADQVAGNEKTSKEELAGKSHVVDASGRVLRDNVWGPQIEDAARRDFTVNALYYDPQRELVVDYHGGLADAKKRVLRMIGDPETRYKEDPVRIVRAVRFAAKLGFELEAKTRAPIKACAQLLANVPASRLFDEMIKLLQTGHSLASLAELRKQGLARGVFPILDAMLNERGELHEGVRGDFVRMALEDTDLRVSEGRGVSPSFMLACMLWFEVRERWARIRDSGEGSVPALAQAVDAVFDARIGDISGRGKLATDMREIWMMQPRFERRTGSGVYTLIEQPRYRAGFDFLRLRADAGEISPVLADWWEDFALGSDDDRAALIDEVRESEKSQRRGGKVHQLPRKPAAEGAIAATEDDSFEPEFDAVAAPAKKRRRRRKPAGKGASAGASAGPSAGAGSAETVAAADGGGGRNGAAS